MRTHGSVNVGWNSEYLIVSNCRWRLRTETQSLAPGSVIGKTQRKPSSLPGSSKDTLNTAFCCYVCPTRGFPINYCVQEAPPWNRQLRGDLFECPRFGLWTVHLRGVSTLSESSACSVLAGLQQDVEYAVCLYFVVITATTA